MLIPAQNTENYCIAQATNFSDFTYEVQMTFVKGDYQAIGGIVFRGYDFQIHADQDKVSVLFLGMFLGQSTPELIHSILDSGNAILLQLLLKVILFLFM